ncbi:MAG TPA: gluconate 2-dehydrogenase subunit 3 family protein [Steroidobacteraceae bacterium]|nr:gluconate 2-dehydrogenase subunit 3 family protein [Steroidobacteraceae bacterium]
MSDRIQMNRRELLQRVAMLMGGAISAPAVLGILNGCSPKPGASWQPLFLSKEEGAVVEAVADLIVPRTDTPGAREVGVPAFIDVILKDVYPSEDQARFVSGLKDFDSEAQRAHGKAFLKLQPAQQLSFLQEQHDAAVAAEKAQDAAKDVPVSQRKRPFVLMMKELTLLGFFTSQVGATKVLQYEAVPGGFKPCVPVAEAGNGRTWATETSLRF